MAIRWHRPTTFEPLETAVFFEQRIDIAPDKPYQTQVMLPDEAALFWQSQNASAVRTPIWRQSWTTASSLRTKRGY